LGLRAGINVYAYVHGDPLRRLDPLGEDDTVCMYDPATCGMQQPPAPSPDLSPALKDYVCKSHNLCSLVETAKANGLEPHAYLSMVFERIAHARAVADFEALLPWRANTQLPAVI
jgi:hypothetical protein